MQGLASQGGRSADCRTALLYLCCLICIAARGNRLCGGDQRALRSPFGNLRIALPCFLIFIAARGNRLCGGDQRALRSPFGNLRIALPCFLIFIAARGNRLYGGDKVAFRSPPLTPSARTLPCCLVYCVSFLVECTGIASLHPHRFGSSVRISLIDMQYGSASWLRPCSRITCAVFCIAGKALRIRWLAWMTMFTPCAASSSSVVML